MSVEQALYDALHPVSHHGPIITQKTTLLELRSAGAETLADIPITELLEFVRNCCLEVAKDKIADEEIGWAGDFTSAAESIQQAIEFIDKAIGNTK